MVERSARRLCADVEQDADIGVENASECIEEPAMRVDFLCVFLLETKDDLDGDNALLSSTAFEIRVDTDLGSILEDVRRDFLPIDHVLHNAVLVAAHDPEGSQYSRSHFITAVANDANYYFLPAVGTPGFRAGSRAQVSNIFHDRRKGLCEKVLVLVVPRCHA